MNDHQLEQLQEAAEHRAEEIILDTSPGALIDMMGANWLAETVQELVMQYVGNDGKARDRMASPLARDCFSTLQSVVEEKMIKDAEDDYQPPIGEDGCEQRWPLARRY